MNSIYLITVVRHYDGGINNDTRCWGWWPTEKEALESIEVNDCDMQECYYNYLVLEQTPSYIGGFTQKNYNQRWYMWDKETDKWIACNIPLFAKNVTAWGMG